MERTLPPDRLAWLPVIAGAGVLAGLSIALYALATPLGVFTDADWYATPWPALVGKAALYPPEWLGPHVAVRPARFNLPPSAALLAPLALSTLLWGYLMTACLVVALRLAWPPLRYPFGLLLLCIVLGWWPTQSAFWWANANNLVLLCLVVALRWPRWSGWAAGVAIAVKLAPLFWLGWLARRDGWRAALIALAVPAAATAVVVALTGPEVLWQFAVLRANETHVTNSFRAGVPLVLGLPMAVALTLAAWWRGSPFLAVLASIVAVPAIHDHYWVWLLPPLLINSQAIAARGAAQASPSSSPASRPATRSGSPTAASRSRPSRP